MFWLLIIVLIPLLFYYTLIKPQLYWRDRNVKQGPPIPLVGDNLGILIKTESMIDSVIRLYKKFKTQRYAGIYQTTLPTLMIMDLDLIKQITIKDFDHFVDHRNFMPEGIDPVWTNNLFTLKGEKWRDMRTTLSPAFTASKMRAMFCLMEKIAQQFVDFYLNQKSNVVEVELKEAFTRFANDVIASCAFGIEIDSLKDPENDFFVNGMEVTSTSGYWRSFKFFMNFSFPKVTRLFNLGIFPTEMAWFFKKIVRDSVSQREEKNIIRPDLIHLLMEARKGTLTDETNTIERRKTTLEFTDDDMAGQALIFFFAGFDTIARMMAFLCFELAVHPDIQEKLRMEIDKVHQENNGQLSHDIINKMKYMEMVISEGMRKNPAVHTIDRICAKPYTIQPKNKGETPVHLVPGDLVIIPVAGIQRDEDYFPNPEVFDPERFSDDNKHNIQSCTFIPFGSGPRICIGNRFALMECKTLVFYLLRNFELTVIDKTAIPFKFSTHELNPAIEGGGWVGLKRRVM